MKSEKQKKHLKRLAQMRVGEIHSYETRKKISDANKGRQAWNKGVPMSEEQKQKLRKPRLSIRGEKNYAWKGDRVGYVSLHIWVRRNFGKPTHCEKCGIDKIPEGKKRFFDWAIVGTVYTRVRSDWIMLCRSCHKKFDNTKRTCKIKRKSPSKKTRQRISQGLKSHFASRSQ